MPETYALPQDLLQAIVSTLAQLPAQQSRQMLNGIEQACIQQDQERAAKADADKLAKAKAQWEQEQKDAAAEAEAEAAARKVVEAKEASRAARHAPPEPTATP